MAILAHRGITATAADNSFDSIAAVRDAVDNGTPIGIEIDVRAGSESLFLAHDPPVEAWVPGGDAIALTDALGLVTNISAVNVEIKTMAAMNGTVDALRSHCQSTGQAASQFVLSSFLPALVRRLVTEVPDFRTGILIDRCYPSVAKGTTAAARRMTNGDETPDAVTNWLMQVLDWAGADVLHAHWSHASPALFAELAKRNKRVSFWTVNDGRLLSMLIERPETENVVTDFPELMFEELHHPSGHRKASS